MHLTGIREQIENERLLAADAERSWLSGFKELFHKGTRNRVAIGLTLMMCQNMTGVNVSPALIREMVPVAD
jgi:hypothetical protein